MLVLEAMMGLEMRRAWSMISTVMQIRRTQAAIFKDILLDKH